MYFHTRQEKTDNLLDQFTSGAILTTSELTMNLYPSEVKRVKRIYPNLSFEVTTTFSIIITKSVLFGLQENKPTIHL